jgi:hypothetical protein
MSEENTVETALETAEKIMIALGANKMYYYTNPFHYRDVFGIKPYPENYHQ